MLSEILALVGIRLPSLVHWLVTVIGTLLELIAARLRRHVIVSGVPA